MRSTAFNLQEDSEDCLELIFRAKDMACLRNPQSDEITLSTCNFGDVRFLSDTKESCIVYVEQEDYYYRLGATRRQIEIGAAAKWPVFNVRAWLIKD
jgi:hypothetical protein